MGLGSLVKSIHGKKKKAIKGHVKKKTGLAKKAIATKGKLRGGSLGSKMRSMAGKQRSMSAGGNAPAAKKKASKATRRPAAGQGRRVQRR